MSYPANTFAAEHAAGQHSEPAVGCGFCVNGTEPARPAACPGCPHGTYNHAPNGECVVIACRCSQGPKRNTTTRRPATTRRVVRERRNHQGKLAYDIVVLLTVGPEQNIIGRYVIHENVGPRVAERLIRNLTACLDAVATEAVANTRRTT